MPFGSVLLRPGINVEATPTLNEAGYSTSQLIRWMQGLAQKIGGWVRYYQFNLGGVPRYLHAWLDLNGAKYLGIGTTTQLSIVLNSALTDITPQTKTTNFAPNFSTVINTATVTIVDSNVTNPTIFDAIFFDTPISVGGIILSGLYQISLVLGTHQYQIVAATNATSTVNNAGAVPVFTTTSGSATVSVAFTAHGLSAGNTINFPITTTVGGVSILGTYTAVSITNANTFTIQASSLASSGTSGSMNSGNCQLVYYIALGPIATSTGYSVGTYSSGAYSTGVTITPQTGTEITATDWSLDNWGQTLLANPAGGGIYQWTPGAGFQNAQLISTAPVTVNAIFVAMPAQILVALGAASPQNIGTNPDPLRVQWSDQLNFNTWTPTTTNQAGSFRIPVGSTIVGGFQGPQFAMIWTDLDLWAMQYLGFPLVFGFNKIGSGCGLIARHAMAQVGQGVFWMSLSNFFVLSGGGATPIPCSVWDTVFQNLDTTKLDKIWAWPSSTFNEVWWFYPSLSGGTGQCDSYVKLNTVENSWDYGTLPRSAGIDQSVLGTPIAATPAGLIFQHEMGENDDGQPISWSFRSGFWTIGDGNNVAFVDWYLPDMIWGLFNQTQTTQISITFYSRFYPGGTETTYGPYVVNSSTPYINPRIRGREMAVQISGSDVNSFVRIGRNRFRFAPDGKNP